jgi:hypothetical protein
VTATYIRRPVEVQAVQFETWISAIEIFDWIPKVLYVPTGHDHPLRNKTEYNQTTDDLFKSATEFLVLSTGKGHIRINPGNWIVKTPDGKLQAFNNEQFHKLFFDAASERSSIDD